MSDKMDDKSSNIFRQFQTDTPWLSFQADLSKALPSLWMTLGEISSKCEHIAGVPMDLKTADELHQLYLAKGVHATTAIEGNTLTEQQVLEVIDSQMLAASLEYQHIEVENIIGVCNEITNDVRLNNNPPLSGDRIKEFNRRVLGGLELDQHVIPGEVRTYSVMVGRYRGAPAEDCEHLIDRMCAWLNGKAFTAPKGQEIPFAVIRAVVAHLYIAWIHPYGDGNGRTARLVEFSILSASGVPSPAAHLLSNHYNLTRPMYYRELEAASKSGGDIKPFLTYASGGFLDGLREQSTVIRDYQWNLVWRHFIEQQFEDKPRESDQRRRRLAIDIAKVGRPVSRNAVAQVSTRVALTYATKAGRTIQRDVDQLKEMKLLIEEGGMISANRKLVLNWLPARSS